MNMDAERNRRLDLITGKFWENIVDFDKDLACLRDCFEYPGKITLISRKAAGVGHQQCYAYISQVKQKKGVICWPHYEISIIIEEFENMTDVQVANLLAHEVSHTLLEKLRNPLHDLKNIQEKVCNLLAEKLFNCPEE